MLNAPQPGDRFSVPGPPGFMIVEECHLGVSENDGSIRYLVRALDGSRWVLVAGQADGTVRRLGVPLTMLK